MLALLLLVVQTRLIEMLDALSTDVIAKMKDATLILLSLVVFDEQIRAVNVVGVCFMIAGTCAYREVRRRDKDVRRSYSAVTNVDADDDDVDLEQRSEIELRPNPRREDESDEAGKSSPRKGAEEGGKLLLPS